MIEQLGWTDSELAHLLWEGLDHLNRLQSGAITERDAAEFIAWRNRSLAHEEAFRAAVRLQRLVRGLDWDLAPEDARNAPNVIPIARAAERKLSRRTLLGGALAASFGGGLLFTGLSLDMVPSVSELRADYRTGAGERRLVQLAGGATVNLNTRTSIIMRDVHGIAGVELVDGEAVLDSRGRQVALIAGEGVSIGNVGRFNARRDGNAVCITCLTGEVEVEWAGRRRRLKATEEVRYDGQGIGAVTAGPDPAVLTAWQSGTLIFREMPMRSVIAEINRYRPGKVYLANEELAERRLTGTYFIDRLNDFFSQVQLGLGVKVMRLPGNIIVLG